MKYTISVALTVAIALLQIWWPPTPIVDRAIWETCVVFLLVALAKLGQVRVDSQSLRKLTLGMQIEVASLSRLVVDLTAEARHDKLTGLGNRNLLEDHFHLAKERAVRNKTTFDLLMVDLNEFKSINDKFGHSSGDEVLIAVASRLLASVRGTDTVIRLGGDEFVVLIEETNGPEELAYISERLMGTFLSAVELSGSQLVHVGASMGMARFPIDGNGLVELLDLADQNMYECKVSMRVPLG